MAAKTATPPDADRQLVVNQVSALVEFYVERQGIAGRTPDEMTQERAALIADIVAALRTRRPA